MTIQQQISIKERRRGSGVVMAGLALFAMFFGSGNLIFPLLIGRAAGINSWFAIGGIGITAVLVPFLGLGAMIAFEGKPSLFFGKLGRIPGFFLLLLLQTILGPLGVIPRLITLMHAATKGYSVTIPLWFFSVITCLVIFVASFRREALVRVVATIFTPVKILSLVALVFLGIWGAGSVGPELISPKESFFKGFLSGYNTMDLIAAFIFATVILPQFTKKTRLLKETERNREIYKKIFFSSLIASSLLLLTYIGLVWVAAYHAWKFDPSFPPEDMLGAIAFQILGPVGGCISMIAITISCLTTAITLSSTFADYLHKDLSKGKISHIWALALTLIVTCFFADLEFSGIIAFLKPILQVIYPGLILLSVLNILHTFYGFRMIKTPVFIAFIFGFFGHFVI